MGPAVLPVKLLLWKLGVSWDESVPQDIYTQFRDYLEAIKFLRHIAIPQ